MPRTEMLAIAPSTPAIAALSTGADRVRTASCRNHKAGAPGVTGLRRRPLPTMECAH